MIFLRVFILIFVANLFSVHLNSVRGQIVEIYVSPSGNDMDDGTKAKPVKTLQKAQMLAKHTSQNNIVIYLREGTHRISSPLVHNASSKTISYTNYPNEKPVVSSSLLLENLKWEKHKGAIMKTYVNQDAQINVLYVNGEKQHMARYPNYDPKVRHFNGFSADAIAPQRVKRWKNPKGGFVHAMHSAEWGGYQYLIKGKTADGQLELEGGFQNNQPKGMHKNYRMVENIFEELDAENEWYYDATKHILYYIPPAGLNLKDATVEAPQTEALFELIGDEQHPITNISIIGLKLQHTKPTFMKTNEPLLRSDWMIYRSGAIYMKGAKDCLVDRCQIDEIGGNAIMISGYARNISITRNHIYNIGASGVCFVGSPNAVRSPSFQYAEYVAYKDLDLATGPKTNEYPAYCLAENNLIHDIGRIEKQVAGFQVSMASNIRIIHNSIYNLPRSGINISEGTWGGHLLDGNDVFNTVLETGDHGSFNSWGRDRFWMSNRSEMDKLVEEHPELIFKDAIETTTISNNRWQCYHGWDIDLDDGSSNYHIYNNLCLNGGIKLREGFNRTVENNIMINNSFHPHVWFKKSKDIFRYNIVMRNFFPIGVSSWGDVINYNLFPDIYSLEASQENGTDKESAYGYPMFIDAEKGDFRVSESSPALKLGFRNFSMTQFGVQYEPLKKIAQSPELPKLVFIEGSAKKESTQTMSWKGAALKTMTTEGERSATGMHSVTGVLITDLQEGSPLVNAGAAINSVIIELEGVTIKDIKDLQMQLPRVGQQNEIRLVIFKNQAKETISLRN